MTDIDAEGGEQLHAHLRRTGQGDQGHGELHRRRGQCRGGDERGDGGGGRPLELARDGAAHHRRRAAGWRDAHGLHLGHLGCRRPRHRDVQLPVDRQRRHLRRRHPPGASGSSYTLRAADVGKTIKVRVSFTDDRGHQESVTSAATTAVVVTAGREFGTIGGGVVDIDEAAVCGATHETAASGIRWRASEMPIRALVRTKRNTVSFDHYERVSPP